MEDNIKIGMVNNCLSLNIREEPKPDATIIFTLDRFTEVVIIEDESTDEYYKICSVSGLEGFCIKKYLTI
jgi:hypothetical protein